jgi:hypothetical protein
MTPKSHAPLPDDLRRFVLTCIASVPHLEALLLLRGEPDPHWNPSSVARRLYLAESVAKDVLSELCAAGLLECSDAATPTYRFLSESPELRALVGRLADAHGSRLIEITNLIHSTDGRRAQRFADAFKWHKDS